MNLTKLLPALLALLFSAGLARAVKKDFPGEAASRSSHIVTGKIGAITSTVSRSASYESTHCVAAIRIEKVEKGDGVKVGDSINVRYIGGMRWIGQGKQPPGPGGHNDTPSEGQTRRVCFSRGADGGFDVYYVSGFTKRGAAK